MCIFSCGEEKRDQKRKCSYLSSCPLSSAGSWGLELEMFGNENLKVRQSYGRSCRRRGKWLTLLSEYLFRRGLQNREMCLLLSVGKLTRNRYADSVMLTAFDTSDSPLVRVNSPHAEMDYCMCLLSPKPTFSNILILALAHLSTY